MFGDIDRSRQAGNCGGSESENVTAAGIDKVMCWMEGGFWHSDSNRQMREHGRNQCAHLCIQADVVAKEFHYGGLFI